MDIFELHDLAEWYRSQFKAFRKVYSDLQTAVSNNASQPTKVPVEEPLRALVEFLDAMDVGQLSLEQLKLLGDLGVRDLLGHEGARWIENVVKSEGYDPATTNTRVGEAIAAISAAHDKLSQYDTAIKGLGLSRPELAIEEGRVIVRVGFRNDAAIKNITDWKVSADDWWHIIRGLALIAGEAPEDTEVVGAATGSLILVLATTLGVTKLLATITKHVTGTAKEILSVGIMIEELRQKNMLSETMKLELETMQANKRASAKTAIEQEIAAALPAPPNGEQATALGRSIQRVLAFGEEGGDIDFVAPPETADEQAAPEGQPAAPIAEIRQVRNLILTYQRERESLKLLEAKAAGEGE